MTDFRNPTVVGNLGIEALTKELGVSGWRILCASLKLVTVITPPNAMRC